MTPSSGLSDKNPAGRLLNGNSLLLLVIRACCICFQQIFICVHVHAATSPLYPSSHVLMSSSPRCILAEAPRMINTEGIATSAPMLASQNIPVDSHAPSALFWQTLLEAASRRCAARQNIQHCIHTRFATPMPYKATKQSLRQLNSQASKRAAVNPEFCHLQIAGMT